jgi:hypothetical protein
MTPEKWKQYPPSLIYGLLLVLFFVLLVANTEASHAPLLLVSTCAANERHNSRPNTFAHTCSGHTH